MRVLFFNYEYPPLGGGAGNATFYLLREFSKIPELKIDLVTSSIDSAYHLETIGERIKIHRLPIGKNRKNFHFQSQRDLLVYAWKAFWFARKLIRKNKYDLSHSFFTVPCGFLSLLFRRQYKIPYIVSLRGADVPGYSERFSLIYVFLKPLIRVIWDRAAHVVSNSRGLRNLALKTNFQQGIDIIYNGIDTKEFGPKNSIFATAENKPLEIICVSRITARKGIKYLIEAVKKLTEEKLNVGLKIIGEGDAKESLKNMTESLKIKNRVEFLGMIEHEKLPKKYQRADVFVLPSLNEGMSNTLLEALSSGLPVVATDTGGTKELVMDGENGFIVRKKNHIDLAEKIEKLAKDGVLREAMGRKSREKAEKMGWDKVAEQYYVIYRNNARS